MAAEVVGYVLVGLCVAGVAYHDLWPDRPRYYVWAYCRACLCELLHDRVEVFRQGVPLAKGTAVCMACWRDIDAELDQPKARRGEGTR